MTSFNLDQTAIDTLLGLLITGSDPSFASSIKSALDQGLKEPELSDRRFQFLYWELRRVARYAVDTSDQILLQAALNAGAPGNDPTGLDLGLDPGIDFPLGPLRCAIIKGDEEAALAILETPNCEVLEHAFEPPHDPLLSLAITNRLERTLDAMLVSSAIDPNGRDWKTGTPLGHCTALATTEHYAEHYRMLEKMLACTRVDPNPIASGKTPPILEALNAGGKRAIEMFRYSKRFDPNIQNRAGNTVIHFAVVLRPEPHRLGWLLEDPRIDHSIRNSQGITAADLAKRTGSEEYIEEFERIGA